MSNFDFGRRIAIFVFAILVLTGCANRFEPVYNVNRLTPPGLTSEQVAAAISAAASADTVLKWTLTSTKPSTFRAQVAWDSYTGDADIAYTDKSYSITFVSEKNLTGPNGTIHRNYNRAVAQLEEGINQQFLIARASGAPGVGTVGVPALVVPQPSPQPVVDIWSSRDWSSAGLFKGESNGWSLTVENKGQISVTLARVDDRNAYVKQNYKIGCRDISSDKNKLTLTAWCDVRLTKPFTEATGFGGNSSVDYRFKVSGQNRNFSFSASAPIGDAAFHLNYQPTALEAAAVAEAQQKAAVEAQNKTMATPQVKAATEAQQNPQERVQEKPVQPDVASRLRVLNGLRDQGLITQSEYDTRRRAILDGI